MPTHGIFARESESERLREQQKECKEKREFWYKVRRERERFFLFFIFLFFKEREVNKKNIRKDLKDGTYFNKVQNSVGYMG